MNTISRTAVFSIVSLNYTAFARTLMESLKENHASWDRHVLLVDQSSHPQSVGGELFTTIPLETLTLPDMNAFMFRYGIMELNTAAKPYMFSYLRKLGYEHIIYIDPDILLIDRLTDVEQLLNEGATAVITPHLTAPLNDDRIPSELDIMRAGAYNLGFVAIGNTDQANAFIQWWEKKLEFGAVSDPAKGLFTDQKWVDLAPGMFGGFSILRDPGYNVAYWNLPHRPVNLINQTWFAGDSPLRFFHFSGFDPLNPQPFSKHQDRLTLSTIGDAKKLALLYSKKVIDHGLETSRKLPYAFGKFSDGTTIPNAIRMLYRDDQNIQFQAGENPFENSHFFIFGESGDLPVILRAVWLEHKHLQRAFPDPLGSHRLAYYHWFVESGALEIGIPEAFIFPIRAKLKKLQEQTLSANAKPLLISELPNYKPSVWARALVFLHKRMTGGHIGHARLTQYQQITNPNDFLRLGFTQFRGSRWAAKLGIGLQSRAKFDPLQVNLPYHTDLKSSIQIWKRAHTQKISGLYIEENQDQWWMGRQARFIIDEPNSKTLRITGIFQSQLIEKISPEKKFVLAVGLNDQPRKQVEITAGQFDVSMELTDWPDTWPAVLHFLASDSFIPKEIGINEDTRRLSIQISSVYFGDKTIFHPHQFKEQNNTENNTTSGLNLIGYARSEHGVGQSLRQFANALQSSNIPYVVIDFNQNNLSRVQDTSLVEKIAEEPVYGINIFHINADQMTDAEMHLPSHLFARYNIGFWHWELPEMLREHMAGFSNLNEVWVPTGFVQDSISKCSPIPVVRMPHAIQFEVSTNASRKQFRLPDDSFLFLMMYDFSSFQERKNPQSALNAFQLAFAAISDSAKKVALVIKTQNAHYHPEDMRALQEKIKDRADIIWINETLSRQEIYDLQSVCDCLVSLHRSEGYGLGPAEAMFLGKPVIATNWSGNTEFMRQDNSLPVNFQLIQIEKDIGVYKAGQFWADPDIEHAANLMRQVVNDENLRHRIGEAAKRTMLEEYSPAIIGERIRRRLHYIQNEIMAK